MRRLPQLLWDLFLFVVALLLGGQFLYDVAQWVFQRLHEEPMHIEVVTVCVEYDDFFELAVRQNQAHFDDWVCVTTAADKGTHAVCERYGIRAVNCPYFRGRFNRLDKARAINYGLAHLTCRDWLLHLDADIALPRHTSKVLDNLPLDPESIYGIDRCDAPSVDHFVQHAGKPDPWEKHYFVRPPGGWKVGSRLSHFDYGQWVPIGFFQLWNVASGITRYPIVENANAEHTDVLHGLQWPRLKRHLIPELYAVHIGTGGPNMGANWDGRKTPRYQGPSAAADPSGDPGQPRGRGFIS
jgi:hypothetical protein